MNKIKTINSLIEKCQCVYDVGSDHALLAISLLHDKKVKLVVNIEKNQQPLIAGKNNLAANHLTGKTLNVLNDGLSNISKKIIDKPNYVVIAGMGANTIIEILTNKDDVGEPTYILEASTEVELLRKWLSKNKWQIISETTCYDRGKYYQIIKTSKANKTSRLTTFNAYLGSKSKQTDLETWYKLLAYTKAKIEAKKLDKYNPTYKVIYKELKKVK